MKNKLIIVAGCSGSGKTTVSKKIRNIFAKKDAQIICVDRFYKTHAHLMPTLRNGHPNFDHPDSIDWTLLRKCIKSLLEGKQVLVPNYNYKTHKREKKYELTKSTKILIFEGFLALYDKEINNIAEIKIFVDTDIKECFKRRVLRDQKERGRTLESIKTQWNESVVPMYNKYVKPMRWASDIVLPWDRENKKSIKYLISAIKSQIKVR